jgi:hypothetical protein
VLHLQVRPGIKRPDRVCVNYFGAWTISSAVMNNRAVRRHSPPKLVVAVVSMTTILSVKLGVV